MSNTVEKKSEDWMQKQWRPAMGWMYMIICFCDMVIFPILWAIVLTIDHQQVVQWNPLTLQGAGLFHIAMGAVLGIAAFGRTQEKLAGTAANPTATTQTVNNNMSGNVAGGFGSNNGSNMGGMGVGGFGGTSSFGGSSLGGNSMSVTPTVAPTITPPPVSAPTSSKSTVPTSGFPPL
jgi:hypothetical protein